jgi:ABC-type phosphate transport system permease subunit
MTLSTKAMALTCGILVGGSIFLVGLVGMFVPEYGEDFLELFAGIYPGFGEEGGFANLLIGTVWGLIDGFVLGFLIAWLYNRFAQSSG